MLDLCLCLLSNHAMIYRFHKLLVSWTKKTCSAIISILKRIYIILISMGTRSIWNQVTYIFFIEKMFIGLTYVIKSCREPKEKKKMFYCQITQLQYLHFIFKNTNR